MKDLKEWLYALFIAISVNGYCKFSLSVPQRLLFIWFLWVFSLCVIYKAEEIIDRVKEQRRGFR